MTWQVIQGDVLNVLKTLDSASFDFVLSDVPYGLGNHEPTPDEVLAFLNGASLKTGDFMGTKWEIPSVEVWREVSRVAKPGAHCFAFGGTRTWDLVSMGLRMAGWTNRDTIAADFPALRWVQAQGMAKGARVGKAIDRAKGAKRKTIRTEWRYNEPSGIVSVGRERTLFERHITAPATPEAAEWEGYGSCLAPTWEPVLVFRKPLDGTLASNVLKHGCGALNVDACRTFTDWSDRPDSWKRSGHSAKPDAEKLAAPPGIGIECHPSGRWPKNAALVHHPSCTSNCVNGCPVKELDGSRFFPSFRYAAKASRQEREIGCHALPARTRSEVNGRDEDSIGQSNGMAGIRRKGAIRNTGKCVKPQAFLRWLVRLGCRPGGRVLVPYCGSGSEMIACVNAGMDVVGIENDPEMIPIAKARIAWWAKHPDLSDEAKEQSTLEASGQETLF